MGINKADARVIAIEGRNGEGILRIARPASRTNVLLKSNPLSRRSFELLQKAIVVQLFLSASDPLTRDSIVLSRRGTERIVKKGKKFLYRPIISLHVRSPCARSVLANLFPAFSKNSMMFGRDIAFGGIVSLLCTWKSSIL